MSLFATMAKLHPKKVCNLSTPSGNFSYLFIEEDVFVTRFIHILLFLLYPWQANGADSDIKESAYSETWKIAAPSWQPYAGPDLPNQGIAVERLRAILHQAGIGLEVEFYPWLRAQRQAQKPGYIGYFPVWHEEVTDGFVASPAVAWSSVAITKRPQSDVQFDSLDQLFEDYSVGMIDLCNYPSELETLAQRHKGNVFGTNSELLLLKKLNASRHEVAISDPKVMNFLAKKHGLPQAQTIKTLYDKPLIIALRDAQDNQANIKRINTLFNEALATHP